MLFHIEALTGEDATYTSQPNELLQGIDVIAGPLVDAFLFRDAATKYVILFDEFLQVSIKSSNTYCAILIVIIDSCLSRHPRTSTILPETRL